MEVARRPRRALWIGPCGPPRLAALASEATEAYAERDAEGRLGELVARGSVSADGRRDDGSGCGGRAGHGMQKLSSYEDIQVRHGAAGRGGGYRDAAHLG
jgi:hypothetical protein